MANSVQQAIFRRKATYLVAILVLLVVNTFFIRGVGSTRPNNASADPQASGGPPEWSVTAQANRLELTELATGEADLTGSAIRLMLTGSRGLALATLWYQSDEKKKKHEWNKLELLVDSITRLQPHTAAPWTFQSWNIAYNVSVESDRVKDKFFYIARGMELLAKGVRLNKDHPDLRYMMGFYYQNKFGVSDEANYLRSLMQMSCIDPNDRNAKNLRKDDHVDPVEFEKFVKTNPQLVRRLREKLKLGRADEIVDFLWDNKSIPCRYYDVALDRKSGLKPATDQFPVLPMERSRLFPDIKYQESDLRDDFDNYQAAESWLCYAQDPLPDPEQQYTMIAPSERARQISKQRKRLPRAPAEVIFRHGPARAQSFVGERLEKEGWFDDSGWKVDGDRVGTERWFEQPLVVGNGVPWAHDAWSKAAGMWRKYGEENGVYYEANEMVRLNEQAKAYRERYHVDENNPGKDIFDDPDVSEEMKQSFKAHRKVFFNRSNLQMTNFSHHYYRAYAEMDPETIQARKLLFEANQLRLGAEYTRAIERYEQAFNQWKKVLLRYNEFREDSGIQEDVYEMQIQYMDLLDSHNGPILRPILVADGLMAQGLATLAGAPMVNVPTGALHMMIANPKPLPLPIVGPLDQLDSTGRPWMEPSQARGIRVRLGKEEEPPADPPSPRDPQPERKRPARPQ